MARELLNSTEAYHEPEVWMFQVLGCDTPWPIIPATPRSWSSRFCRQYREFAGGRKTYRSSGVASGRFVEYFLFVVVLAKCKKIECLDFPCEVLQGAGAN
jgi:hypothetical protein